MVVFLLALGGPLLLFIYLFLKICIALCLSSVLKSLGLNLGSESCVLVQILRAAQPALTVRPKLFNNLSEENL